MYNIVSSQKEGERRIAAQFPNCQTAKTAFSLGEVEFRCLICGDNHSSSREIYYAKCYGHLKYYLLLFGLASLIKKLATYPSSEFKKYFTTLRKNFDNFAYIDDISTRYIFQCTALAIALTNVDYEFDSHLLALSSIKPAEQEMLRAIKKLSPEVRKDIFNRIF